MNTETNLVYLGTVSLEVERAYQRFETWLAEGRAGGMEYLRKYPDLRNEPEKLLPGAKAALIFGLPYDLGDTKEIESPRVAQYARIEDYHRHLKKELEKVAASLPGTSRVLVDTAPVLERALAAKCKTGFIGKNTCFIHPKHGSFLLLGEIFTTGPVKIDLRNQPEVFAQKTSEGGCGPCRLCQDVCPTGALNKDYSIDAGKCLAYWTIEHRGPIPEEYWPHLKDYYFGCDLCQTACPYNHPRKKRSLLEGKPIPELFEIATMDEAFYQRCFGGTAMTRAKRNGLRRNALIALFVTGHPRMSEALEMASQDPTEPVGETIQTIRSKLLGWNSQNVESNY